MMGLSFPHLIIAGLVVLVLFGGKGKISDIMGDFAKGIKSFKKGMSDDEVASEPRAAAVAEPVRPLSENLRTVDTMRTIDHRPVGTVESTTDTRRVG